MGKMENFVFACNSLSFSLFAITCLHHNSRYTFKLNCEGLALLCTLIVLSLSPLMILVSSYCRQYTPLLVSLRQWIRCSVWRPVLQLLSILCRN